MKHEWKVGDYFSYNGHIWIINTISYQGIEGRIEATDINTGFSGHTWIQGLKDNLVQRPTEEEILFYRLSS